MVVDGSRGLYFGTFRLLLQTTFSGPLQNQRTREGESSVMTEMMQKASKGASGGKIKKEEEANLHNAVYNIHSSLCIVTVFLCLR